MRALVTGATGFVGRRLLTRLDSPVVLSRDAEKARVDLAEYRVTAHPWNPTKETAPAAALEGVDTVFHLAGEPVAEGRWNKEKKHRLRASRVDGTRHLVEALTQAEQKPDVLVSASAVGFYGSRDEEVLDESALPSDDFLAEMCVAWESEAQQARDAGIRVVTVRIGIVLGKGGGALSKMLLPFRLGLGSPLGNGRQWMPWIHIDDLVSLLLHVATHDTLDAPVNGTSPNPVTNRQFTKTLGKVLHRPTFFPPVPGPVLRVAMGEFGSILLTSQRALPKAALEAGFQFQYPELESALESLLRG